MPTITIGGRAGATFSGMQDATLLSSFADNNLSAETSSGQLPFLLRPDLSGIPAGSTITDAFWTINVTSGAAGAFDISPKRVLRAWVEAQASWNSWSTGNAWTTPGALGNATDRVAAASCVLNYTGGYATGDVVSTSNSQLIADIQAVVSGGANNGYRFEEGLAIALPANATAALRPQLTVVYSAPVTSELTGNASLDGPSVAGGIQGGSTVTGNATLDSMAAGGTLAQNPATDLSGGGTLDSVSASGTLAQSPATTLSGDAALDGVTAVAGNLGQAGTITSQPLKRNNGTVVVSQALTWVGFRNATTGADVVVRTGISTNALGVFSVSDGLLQPGATYAVQWRESSGHHGEAHAVAV